MPSGLGGGAATVYGRVTVRGHVLRSPISADESQSGRRLGRSRLRAGLLVTAPTGQAPGTGHRALSTGYWALGIGHWALDTEHWALGTGAQCKKSGFTI